MQQIAQPETALTPPYLDVPDVDVRVLAGRHEPLHGGVEVEREDGARVRGYLALQPLRPVQLTNVRKSCPVSSLSWYKS